MVGGGAGTNLIEFTALSKLRMTLSLRTALHAFSGACWCCQILTRPQRPIDLRSPCVPVWAEFTGPAVTTVSTLVAQIL